MTGPPASPLDAAVASFARYLRAANRSPKTQEVYLSAVRKLRRWIGEHAPEVTSWEDLRAAHVNGFIASIFDADFSAAYASNLYRAIQQFVKWLRAEEEISTDPLAGTSPPQVPDKPVPVLTPEQLRALLRVCEGRDYRHRRDMAIIRLFLDTGIRLAELAGLGVDDLDLDTREATVMGKNRRPRTVVFGHRCCLALDRFIRSRATQRAADRPELWLSTGGRGGYGPMSRSGIYQVIQARGEQAGVEGLHPHVLRHTWAHHARLEGRLHDDEVMRLAGWRSRSMLNRYAASAADERARDAGKRAPLGDQL